MKQLLMKQTFELNRRFTITDEAGQIAYEVRGQLFQMQKNWQLVHEGSEVGRVTKQTFSMLPHILVEVDGHVVTTIQKTGFVMFSNYRIDSRELHVDINWATMTFSVMYQGNKIGQGKRRWVRFGKQYELTLFDEAAETLFLNVVLGLDRAKADKTVSTLFADNWAGGKK
ncbi:LURP-one-related/scramblase family protein [Exiguobacterium artemiae]|uniref:LURP-one-related/scramblase family protein n=2 Tax=Exiguobacterium artemiae TaxID=340145 RepID=UPI003D08867A